MREGGGGGCDDVQARRRRLGAGGAGGEEMEEEEWCSEHVEQPAAWMRRRRRGRRMTLNTKSAPTKAVLLLFLLVVFFGFHEGDGGGGGGGGGGARERRRSGGSGGGVAAARATPPPSSAASASSSAGTARVLRGARAVEIGLGSPLLAGEVKGGEVKWEEREAPEGAVTAVLIPDPSGGEGSYFGFYGFYGFYGMEDATGALLHGLEGDLDTPPPSDGTEGGDGTTNDTGSGGDGGDGGGANSLGLAANATCGERLVAVVNSTNVTGILTEPREYLNCTCVYTLYREAFGVTATAGVACGGGGGNGTETGDGNAMAAGAAGGSDCNGTTNSSSNPITAAATPPPPPPLPPSSPVVNVTAVNGTGGANVTTAVNGTGGANVTTALNVSSSASPPPPPAPPAPLEELVMCSVLFSDANLVYPPPPPSSPPPPPVPPLTPSNATSPEAAAWAKAADEAVMAAAANVTNATNLPLLVSREKLLLHAPWVPAGVDILNTSLTRVDVDGFLAAENTRRATVIAAAAAAAANATNATAAGVNSSATPPPPPPPPPLPPSYTVLPHPLPDMAAAGLWPLRYPAMTVPGAGGKPVCMLDPPTAGGLMPAPGSGGFLTREAFGEYIYAVLLPDMFYNRSDGVVMRTNWSLDNVTGLFGDCIGDPPGPPKAPKKDPLQWLYDDPILGALIGTSLPGIIAGVMKKFKDSQEKLVKAKRVAMDKFKELKKKEVKWTAKVAYKSVQIRREKKSVSDGFTARINVFYTYKPTPQELKPFKGDKLAFRKAKQQEIKDERRVAVEALDEEFDDYEDMYEARVKERLEEILGILSEAMPKQLAQTFVDNVNLLPLEALEQMEKVGQPAEKKKTPADNQVVPEPGTEGGAEGAAEGAEGAEGAAEQSAAEEGNGEVAVVSTNPKVVNFKRKKGAQLPPLPGLPAPLAVEPGADATAK